MRASSEGVYSAHHYDYYDPGSPDVGASAARHMHPADGALRTFRWRTHTDATALDRTSARRCRFLLVAHAPRLDTQASRVVTRGGVEARSTEVYRALGIDAG